MTISYLLDGLFIGLLFGIPIGTLGAMSIQRTINYGLLAGILSGLASSLADVIYACIGTFNMTLIADFLLLYQILIHRMGAILIFVIAVTMLVRKDHPKSFHQFEKKAYYRMFLSSFGVAICNPAAILSFPFAFSIFHIDGNLYLIDKLQVIFGIFVGTMCWWLLLASVVKFMKQKVKEGWLRKLNILFALMLIVMSSGILINTF